MLKSLAKILVAFLRQMSSVSPQNVAFTFFQSESSPDAGPGRCKCGCQAVFAKSLDGRF